MWLAKSGPPPPSAISANSRGSKPLRTDDCSIASTIECTSTLKMPSAASSVVSFNGLAIFVSTALRARSTRRSFLPPRNNSERNQPSAIIASVAVGSVPPWSYAAGPGMAPAERGPTRKMPPESMYAIEPPPAPIVSTSTIGIIAWYGPTFVSSRCFMRSLPSCARPMSADVPPTSSVITFGSPATRPAQMPPTTPAIGPDINRLTGRVLAACGVATPAALVISCTPVLTPILRNSASKRLT